MQRVIVVDSTKCTGCRICEDACSFSKTESFSPIQSRIKIIKDEALGIAVPVLCAHCAEPPCQYSCPLDLISVDKSTGWVVTREAACVGCRACLVACIFGAVSMDTTRGVAVHCDLCGGDPLCVKFCPTGALQYVPLEAAEMPRRREFAAQLSKSLIAARKL